MNQTSKKLLRELNIKNVKGAYNIRENSQMIKRESSNNVKITSKKNKNGINININKNTKEEKIYIPVILTKGGITDIVYNDFYIEENAEVTIYAGCAIHNEENNHSIHEGIHTFHIEKGAKVKYIEKHIGNCEINNNKTINTETIITLKDNAEFIMDTIQLRGVDKSKRITNATLNNNSLLKIKEKLLTGNTEKVTSIYNIDLNGKNSKLTINSRTISKNNSQTDFTSTINGNNACFGHVECDAIIMDNAKVSSTPKINAFHKEATLSHEAAVGKIAKDQINKLMSLGLNKKEAEQTIINSFLN